MKFNKLYLFYLVVTFTLVVLHSYAVETEEFVIEYVHWNASIRVDVDLPKTKTLVTGINVEKLMKRYFLDYDQLELGHGSMLQNVVYGWERYIRLPELKLNRIVRMYIGVYKSHKEAVKRGILSFETESLGFMYKSRSGDKYELIRPAHCMVQLQDKAYVKNNVFIFLVIFSGPYDNDEILDSILDGIESGIDGVITLGDTVEIPIIDDAALPDEITFSDDETMMFPVKVIEPNNRNYEFHVEGRYYSLDDLFSPEKIPIQWDQTNGLQIQQNVPMETALIEGTVANELNVLSELWIRKIKINAPEESAVSHFSSM